MTATVSPLRGRIRSLGAVLIAAVFLAETAVAQPFPAAPEPAKPPANRVDPVVKTPVVAVIDLRADKGSYAISKVIQQAIVRRSGELRVPEDSGLWRILVEPLVDEDTRAVAEARDSLDQARVRMANFQLPLAIDRAQNGRNKLINVVPTPATTSLLADLVFAEGQAHLANLDKTSAATAFALVHQLTPGRTLDPNRYLPEVVEAFTVAGRPPTGTGTIEVTANGTIFLDGHPRGQDKQTLVVAPGLHIVAVTGPERLPEGEVVAVAADETKAIRLADRTATVDLRAGRARKALITAPDATARAGLMRQIAELAQLTDAVLVTSDAKGGPAVQLWRNRAPGFQEVKTISHTLTLEEADKIIAPLVPPKPDPVDPGPGPFIPPITEPPKEWYQKRWVQVGLVGGAVALVAGFFLARNAIGAETRGLGEGGLEEVPAGRE